MYLAPFFQISEYIFNSRSRRQPSKNPFSPSYVPPSLLTSKDVVSDLAEKSVGKVGSIGRDALDEAEGDVVGLDGAGHRKRGRGAERVVDGVETNQRTTPDLMEPVTQNGSSIVSLIGSVAKHPVCQALIKVPNCPRGQNVIDVKFGAQNLAISSHRPT